MSKYRGNIVAVKISWQYYRGKNIAKVNMSSVQKYRNNIEFNFHDNLSKKIIIIQNISTVIY